MESKAKNVQEKIYKDHDLNQRIYENEKFIETANEEIASLQDSKNNVDYQNLQLVGKYFDEQMEDNIARQRQYAEEQAEWQLNVIKTHQEELRLNYSRFSSWFRKSQAERIVSSCRPRIYDSDDIQTANGSLVIDCSGKGKIVLTILTFLMFGPAVIVYIVSKKILDIFVDTFADFLLAFAFAVTTFYYWVVFLSGLFTDNPLLSKLPLFFIVVAIAFVVYERSTAKSCLKKDADKFLAIYDPERYIGLCYDYIMADYEKNTLAKWRAERSHLESGGEISSQIIESLKECYEQKNDRINELTQLCEQKQNEIARDSAESDSISEILIEYIAQSKSPIIEPTYNNGVLTDHIARSNQTKNTIHIITHNCKPTTLVYDEDIYNNQNEIRKAIADLISDLYYGLVNDNYHGIVDYRLIDFETGGAMLSASDEARQLFEAGIIRVYHNDSERNKLYNELKQRKELVIGAGGTGDIRTLNPRRLQSGDDTLSYYIVLHFGKEAFNLHSEIIQLYKGGDVFGFIPFFIMSQKEYDDILKDEHRGIYPIICDGSYIKIKEDR